MKREQQLDQVDRLTRPMELRFASAYRRFIGRLRPSIVANVRAGRAPDAAGSKDKLPRAFASIYRRDIAAGRVQAERQIPKKPAKSFFKARPRRRPMSDLEAGATREIGLAGTARVPYATGATFDVGDLIDASLARLGGTLDTLDDRLELVIADAPDDATDEELADLIEEELDAFEDNGKIEDIAETEVFGSVNGGRAQAFAENEVEWGEWGTVGDNRVRETHVDLGKSGVHPIGFNYAKLVDFPETLLRWPHDVECEEPSLVCNCRCALLYAEAPANAAEIYDEEMGDLGDEGKSFKDFDPGQPRDESGKWSSDGGGGGGADSEGGGGGEDRPEDQAARDKATERFASEYANNKEAVLAKYTERTSMAGGFYISADEAKELSEDYSKDPDGRAAFSAAVHDTSAAIAREAYARALDAPVAPGHERVVVFTAGGPGSGKTSGIANMPAGEALLASAHTVVDSTLGGSGATKQIEQALEKGYAVSLIFTYRDPEEAFMNGVVPRANRYGRIVPVPEAMSSHANAYERMRRLTEKYRDDPRLSLTIIDNSRGRGNARLVDKLPKEGKHGRETEARIYRKLDQLWREGKIKPAVYRGLKAAAGRRSAQ